MQPQRMGWHGVPIDSVDARDFVCAPLFPLNAEDASHSLDIDFIDTRRVFMANRGIWEAIATAGPASSFAHTDADIDYYLTVLNNFLDEIT